MSSSFPPAEEIYITPPLPKGKQAKAVNSELGSENEPVNLRDRIPAYVGGTLYPIPPPDGDVKLTESSIPSFKPKLGRRPLFDPRMFNYDVTAALKRPTLAFSVPKLDRMAPSEAGDKLKELHAKAGLADQVEEVLWTFDKALFFYHTINGGSHVQPAAGNITIENPNNPDDPFHVSMREIVGELGLSNRKFFRAFSEVITVVNKMVKEERDPEVPESIDRYDQLMHVAALRGMMRYPELCHDSADACYDITCEERAMILASKAKILRESSKTAQQANPFSDIVV